MKLKKEFITHDLGTSQMMVDTSANKNKFNGIVKSNSTAAFIINLLKEDQSEETLLKAMLDEYEVDEENALKAIKYVVEKLNSINALE